MKLKVKAIAFAVALSSLLSLYNVEAAARSRSQPPDHVVKRICEQTQHPPECKSSVVPFLPTDGAIDASDVLKAGLEALTERTRQAIAEAEKQQQDAKTGRETKQRLEKCIDFYHQVINSTAKAKNENPEKDYDNLKTEIESELQSIGHCDDLFPENGSDGQKGPLEDVNTWLGMLAQINVDIVTKAVKENAHRHSH